MGRPHKKRCVSHRPRCNQFTPLCAPDEDVTLTLDEFETIQWIDVEGLSQENCANVMNVSRTTVQRAYASAREKIGYALVNGAAINIEGGPIEMVKPSVINKHLNDRGELHLKLAIGIMNNKVSMHFGPCNDFRIITIEDGQAVKSEDIHDEVHVHQERPQFLKNLGIDVLILGGIGKAAYNRLLALDIECIDGAGKDLDEALEAYLNKTLDKPLFGHASNGHGMGNHGVNGHEHHDHDHIHIHHANGGKGNNKA